MFRFKVKHYEDTFSVHKTCTKLLTVTTEKETKEKKMYILELYYITLYLNLLSDLPTV